VIITRTPFRVSFFGGGTDYPAWFAEHGGAVIGTTIDKYCYITIRELPKFFEHNYRIVYSVVETVQKIEQIQHPSVRTTLTHFGVKSGLEIHHDGDLPARAGLGSSSSFTVGLVQALRALNGRISSPKYLASKAINIEQNLLKEAVGSQDQIWAAYGGTNLINFRPDGTFHVEPLIISNERKSDLESHLMLFFTGQNRFAVEFAQNQLDNLANNVDDLHAIRKLVNVAHNCLTDPQADLGDFGRLLDEGWLRKRRLGEGVTNPSIDDLYKKAKGAGAIGGKLLGAGGGGFFLLFVEPDKQQSVRNALQGLVEVPIKISSPGSKVMVYDPASSEECNMMSE
jgi:D-glycero-alpha-D-manno-heptose-7-phosphate kinase